MPDLCILTPQPGYYEMTEGPAGDYRRLFGDDVVFRPWTDPGDLGAFALILPLLSWGYHLRAPDWFAALDAWQGLPFANAIPTLRWNSDKRYLLELESAGVAIVPTLASNRLNPDDLMAAHERFGVDQLIIKPAISGGADRTYRIGAGESIPANALETDMLIQPLVPAIANEGEYSLFHFDGIFSHSIVKRPAAGDFRVQEQFGGREFTIDAPASAATVARAAIAACSETPLYARVDLVRGADGGFQLMELELIEPSLFLEHAPDSGAIFAEAVAKRLSCS